MRRPVVCALLWLGSVAPLSATNHSLNIEIDRVAWGESSAQGIALKLESKVDAMEFELALASVKAAGLDLRELHWHCAPTPAPTNPADPLPTAQAAQTSPPGTTEIIPARAPPACEGPLTLAGRPHGVLRWDATDPQRIAWQERAAKLQVQRDQQEWVVELERLPLQGLKTLLGAWSDAVGDLSITSGTLSGTLRWQQDEQTLDASIDGRDIGFDARGGRAGGAGIVLISTLRGQWGAPGEAALTGETELRAGEWLAGPFYAQPPSSLRLGIDATLQQNALRRVEVRAADALGNALDARVDWAQGASLEQASWQTRLRAEAVERARAPYLEGLLAWAGLAELQPEGQIAIEVDGEAGVLQHVLLQSSGLALRDAKRGLDMSGAAGVLGWQREGAGPAGRWTVAQMRLAGVDLGALEVHGQARDGRWTLLQPLQIKLFGGRLDVSAAEWAPRAGEALLSAQMADIELAQLTAWLEWPLIEGRLSGKIPAARYAQERWVLDGGLSGSLLGGQLTLDALSWERPFGIAPSISADIRFNDLDLEPLTATFGFGAISGRLDGEILGLRMLDGAPVQFDARLHTDPNWKGAQRISQRAVRDLSNVGGAGIAGGIQQSVLRAFDEFSYRRIGLSCKLEQDVCLMGGLDSRNGGYTVVEGAGLPRITVNGFQRRVDWPVLLARLEAATAGRGIRVE